MAIFVIFVLNILAPPPRTILVCVYSRFPRQLLYFHLLRAFTFLHNLYLTFEKEMTWLTSCFFLTAFWRIRNTAGCLFLISPALFVLHPGALFVIIKQKQLFIFIRTLTAFVVFLSDGVRDENVTKSKPFVSLSPCRLLHCFFAIFLIDLIDSHFSFLFQPNKTQA